MRFALIGAAGYIAPKHLKAIKAVGGELVAAVDPNDSVGVLDSYFPAAQFFTEFERFDRFVEKLRHEDRPIDYVVVCSPNYLHDAHCRWAMRMKADAICEKPLVINARNLDGLARVEYETGKRVWSILQLRLHPQVLKMKAIKGRCDVVVEYVTPRGCWYDRSWKGDASKSGGLVMNIGIHLFDMLWFVFGPCRKSEKRFVNARCASGHLESERASIDWMLSVNPSDLPDDRNSAYRRISVNGETFDMSEGFTDLHEESYRQILAGKGFGIEDCRPSIRLVNGL